MAAIDVGMMLLDASGVLQFSNNTACRMLGDGRDEGVLTRIDSIHPDLISAIERMGESGQKSFCFDLNPVIGNVHCRLLIEMFRIDDASGQRFLVTMRDKFKLQALDRDLQTATRFRSLATLHVGAAHDLRGPLNNIVVNLEILKQVMKPPAQDDVGQTEWNRRNHHINVIQQEIYRLNRYVQALLELTSPSQDARQDTDVVQILTEISGLIRAQTNLQRIRLECQLPGYPIIVQARQDNLKQVFLNIIINALEAMPSGGNLLIALREEANVMVAIIQDTGEGIPEPLRQRIFEMHFTTKESATGIGLYAAKSIVDGLGGDMTVACMPGEGACFTIRLPKSGSGEHPLGR